MLELTYVSVLFAALGAAFLGLVAKRQPVVMNVVSMALFATFAVESFGVSPSFGSGSAVNQPGMFVLGVGGTLIMLIFTLSASIDSLPRVGGDDAPDVNETGENRVRTLLRGNDRL